MRFNDRTFGHAERIIREPVANSSPELLRRGLMKKSSFGCQQQIIIVAAGATLLHQTELSVVVWEHANTK